MKNFKLILVRHAKSSWEHNVSDVKRPLKKRGVNDALLVSNQLKTKLYVIDKVFTSHANRAHSTCKIFQETLNWPNELISVKEELYDFSGESVIDFISNINDNLKTVVIFGHNHAFTSIANIYGDRIIDNLPTAGAVVLSFNADSWKYVKYGTTELMMFPRDFK
ncbi:SixA phosphatase family protein [Winogradskyella litorisediminis]|uniref:SixA phosphatase family protein n=1 Tax=Winogradskyella litorisediminis TaxID=1156618 RepID=A0ABW3N3U1_9FLAO